MPVSKYDNPAEYKPLNTFQSEYVPMPFQEIAYALGNKQKKKDDELLDIQNRANALNIATIREHEQPREQFVNQYNQKFMGLLDSGIDPTSVEFVRKKKEILDEIARDPRPGVFKRSVDAFKQQQEYSENLRKQGKYGYYNDPYSRGFQGTDEVGNLNEYQFKPYNPTEDRIEPVLNFFKNVKPSGREAEWFQLDESGNIIGIKKGYEGVSENFIKRISENYLQPFLNSNAGRDFVSEYTNLGYGPDQIEKLAKQHIQELGQVFIHGKSSESTNFKYAPEYVASGKAEAAFNTQAPITYNPATVNPFQGEKIDLNKDLNQYLNGGDGKYYQYLFEGQPISAEKVNELKTAEGGGFTDFQLREVDPKEIEELQNKKVGTLKQKYKKIYGEDINNKEIVELHNKAIENSANYIPRDKNFSGKGKAEMITNQVLGSNKSIRNILGKPLELLGSEGGKQINSDELEQLIKDNGGIESTGVQGRLLDHPTKPGGYVVSIETKDGKNIKVAVGADEQTEGWFKNNVAPATKANLSGNDTSWQVGRNKFETISVPKKDGSGFATKVITTSPSGTFETDYKDFIIEQHNIYDEVYKPLQTAGYTTSTENKKLNVDEE